jgi:membrane associated rhomboid family serine protease
VLPIRDLVHPRRPGYVTWCLIAVNIAVFFALQPSAFRTFQTSQYDTEQETSFLYQHALVPCEIAHWHPLSPSLVGACGGDRLQPALDTPFYPHKSVALSLLASMFLHASLLHLFGNMWFLWVFGDNVEDRFGKVGYLAFYLAGGVVASLGQVLGSLDSLVPTIGASGAIAAVMGAYVVLYPRGRVVTIVLPLLFPLVLPAVVVLGFWFALQFVTDPSSGVAWVAHVTGFAFGVLTAFAVSRASRALARRS